MNIEFKSIVLTEHQFSSVKNFHLINFNIYLNTQSCDV